MDLGVLQKIWSRENWPPIKMLPNAILCLHFTEAITFIKELGHRIRAETGEPRSLQFPMQGIAVAVQRGNAAAVRGTSPPTDNGFI